MAADSQVLYVTPDTMGRLLATKRVVTTFTDGVVAELFSPGQMIHIRTRRFSCRERSRPTPFTEGPGFLPRNGTSSNTSAMSEIGTYTDARKRNACQRHA